MCFLFSERNILLRSWSWRRLTRNTTEQTPGKISPPAFSENEKTREKNRTGTTFGGNETRRGMESDFQTLKRFLFFLSSIISSSPCWIFFFLGLHWGFLDFRDLLDTRAREREREPERVPTIGNRKMLEGDEWQSTVLM